MTDPSAIPAAADVAPAPAEAAPTRKSRLCPECGEEFHPPVKGPGQHKRFCSPACKLAFANREKAQGAVVVSIAKVWRMLRGSTHAVHGELGKRAFHEMTSILDQLIDADRKAGRADRLPDYVKRVLDGDGDYRASYMDRRRR